MNTHPQQFWRSILTAAVILGGGLLAPAARAAEDPKSNWDTTAAAGLTLTQGNSKTVLGNLSLDTKRKWDKDEVSFGTSAGYGKAKIAGVSQKNTEYIQGYGQYNRMISEKFYGGLRLDGLYDGIAGVDYRFRVSPLFGYYLIKNDTTSLRVEAGPSAVMEHLKRAKSQTYLGARFGERFDHKLTDTTKIWQSFEYIPQVDRWSEKYLLLAELGIDAGITKKLSLRAVIQDNYDSKPAPGRQKNDLRLVTGLAYKF